MKKRAKWTKSEEEDLLRLESNGCSWKEIAQSIGRSYDAVKSKRARMAIKGDPHPAPQFNLPVSEFDVDEWLDAIEGIQSLRLRAHPSIVSAEVKIDTDMPMAFVATSCWHIGGIYVSYDKFRKRLDELLSIDRLYWLIMGDEYEGFPPGWAATVFQNIVPPADQRILVGKIIDKIHNAGKLLASCWGNHPAFLEKLTGEDQMEAIYRDKVPYFKGRGVLKLCVGEQLYVMSLAHSFPGSSIYNPNHPQSRELRTFNFADFVISGHKHNYSYQTHHVNARAAQAGLTEVNKVHLVAVGTAKDGPDPYTLRKWEQPVFDFDTWPTFCLSPRAHKIHHVHDIEALRWYLGREEW